MALGCATAALVAAPVTGASGAEASADVFAEAPAAGCPDVMVYAVRGSGQAPKTGAAVRGYDPKNPGLGYAATWDAFDPISTRTGGSSIAADIPFADTDPATQTPYNYDVVQRIHAAIGSEVDLGWAPIRYPAVPANLYDIVTDYDWSVEQGVRELARVLAAEQDRCGTRTRFVLTGFSQGSDVIYSYLAGRLSLSVDSLTNLKFLRFVRPSAAVRAQIAAVALIADPNNDTRDPESYVHVDPAMAPVGGLKASTPPLPHWAESVTDSFCFPDDAVCGAGVHLPSKHERDIHSFWYDDAGHPVVCRYGTTAAYRVSATECAADRAVWRLGLRNQVRDPVGGSPTAPGANGLDVVFVIDTTGSMADDIDQAKQFARQAADRIAAQDGRVALVEYRDSVDRVPASILTPLTDDQAQFRAELATLRAHGGGDTPEGLLHALTVAFQGLDWRRGATKAAVVLTDAGYHDPDRTGGETLKSVSRLALHIDPVNVFPVSPELSEQKRLAKATSGELVDKGDDTVSALFEALNRIIRRPVARLDQTSYFSPAQRAVGFDASASRAYGDGEVVSYDWDFDGDGVFDRTTTTPTTTYRYPPDYTGEMQVRVVDTDGRFGNASARVSVAPQDGLTVAGTPPSAEHLSVVGRPARSAMDVHYTWSSLSAPQSWAVTVDGAVVDTVPGDSHGATVTMKPWDHATRMGVYPISDDGLTGADTDVVMAPADERVPGWERVLLKTGVGLGGVVFSTCLPVWWWRRRRAVRVAGG